MIINSINSEKVKNKISISKNLNLFKDLFYIKL